jgi:rhombotail lipoprotein
MLPRIVILMVGIMLIQGCSTLWFGDSYEKRRDGTSSSLVDYLYPDGRIPPPAESVLPQLNLPLRVGIAFVPARGREDITAAEKQALLDRVAAAFRDRDYVESIETIPEDYLRSTQGITGMQQVAALYSLDVFALVSYDQVAFSGERESSLLYWTIVGAVVVKGNRNEVQTMIDTAVFDVQSARLLFRAPGMHLDQRNATLVDSARDLRTLRSEGFVAATDVMIGNLDGELEEFRAKVKEGQGAQVAWRQGSGGGDAGWQFVLALLLLALGWKGRHWRH